MYKLGKDLNYNLFGWKSPPYFLWSSLGKDHEKIKHQDVLSTKLVYTVVYKNELKSELQQII